eukprot:8784167-Alexandrium_andersonii.AAC.1
MEEPCSMPWPTAKTWPCVSGRASAKVSMRWALVCLRVWAGAVGVQQPVRLGLGPRVAIVPHALP